MSCNYFIIYNPLNYNLMELLKKENKGMMDIISHLSKKEIKRITEKNYLEYIDFAEERQRTSMIDTLAIEPYPALYIQNQIAELKKEFKVIMADGKRRYIGDIIKEKGCRPKAVFITSMSSNFPAASAAAILLNHADIPVVIGGIHVSTSPEDVEIFIRKHCKNKEIVSIVKGAGDKKVLSMVLSDLEKGSLHHEYTGYRLIENGNWKSKNNIEKIPPLKIGFLQKIPLIKYTSLKHFRIIPSAPFVGCPYSCSFCSISTLPKKMSRMIFREIDDFIDELLEHQKNGIDFTNRYFFFTTDNLLLGKKRLKELLGRIIKSDLKINYAVQISIEIADDEELMKLMRRSGATHFFIGMESLDLKNLEHINKHIVPEIKKSGKTVKEFYADKIKKIHAHGFSIHGSFIFGLPHDYFKTPYDNTGVETARFCVENKIGLQPSTITDLPGSKFFNESQKNKSYLYGEKGSMEYFISLCGADLIETNRIPPESLMNSPILIAIMSYEASRQTGCLRRSLWNAAAAFVRSFKRPTVNGQNSFKERLLDSLCSSLSQIAVSLYKEQFDSLFQSLDGREGVLERLFKNEQNRSIKKITSGYVKRFTIAKNRKEDKPSN